MLKVPEKPITFNSIEVVGESSTTLNPTEVALLAERQKRLSLEMDVAALQVVVCRLDETSQNLAKENARLRRGRLFITEKRKAA